MKKETKVVLALVAVLILAIITSISISKRESGISSQTSHTDNVTSAREKVIRYVSAGSGNEYAVEQIYKRYPNDATISNLYFYYIAKEQYSLYQRFAKDTYLQTAKDYAANIDPTYGGALSKEIQSFANEVMGTSQRTEIYQSAQKKTNTYLSLTDFQKKEICNYIQRRYDYYDRIHGRNMGDTYTDRIWKETCEMYGLTESQLDIIWMNMYSY